MAGGDIRDGSRYRHNYPPAGVYILAEDMDARAAVCQSNQSENRILLADPNDANRMPAIGALLERKLSGQEGLVVSFGVMPDLQRTEDFGAGDPVWVSETRGKFTKNQPTSGIKQVVGEARNSSSALLFCVPPQIPVSYGYKETGNHTILVTDGTDEVSFAEDFSVWHHGMLWVEFDLSTVDVGRTVTARLYHKIDGTYLKQIARKHALVGTDEDHLTIAGAVTSGLTIQLSLQVSAAVGADRVVNHVFIQDS